MTDEHHEHHNTEHHEQHASPKHDGEGSTITFKKTTLWKVGTFLFLGLFILSIVNGGFGFGGSGTGAVIAPITGNNAPSPTPGNVKVSIADDDPILGNKDAPINIIEFSDFECPFCGRAHTGALAEFKTSDYFKNGEVNLVYKHLPLNSIHPRAQKAAEASVCANNQGQFWEYHDLLFANQQSLSIDSLKNYAVQLGLDTGEFNDCLDSGDSAAKVRATLGEATAAGGRGTPYFIVMNADGDTIPVSGAVPWSNFESAIQALS